MRLQDFDDFRVKGTVAKNNHIYTSLYNYYKDEKDENRHNIVGWLAHDSQLRNFLHVLPHIQEGGRILDYGCGIGDLVPFLYSNISEWDEDQDIDYKGVDINPTFIQEAKSSYPGFEFEVIKKATDIRETFDTIVVIGVFTWFITKKDFEQTIRHLFKICRKKLVITCISTSQARHSWTNTYRGYSPEVFKDCFPDLKMNMSFKTQHPDLIVVFEK